MTAAVASSRHRIFAQLIEEAKRGADQREPLSWRVPVELYTDQALFERERDQLFLQRPLALCPSSQIPHPGDALVHDWLGLPLLTVRDRNGRVSTFFNVCRHRNMRLVPASGYARLKALVCPYHQWAYGLDGGLTNIPLQQTFDGLDRDKLGLVSVPTEERHGLIWIQATPDQEMDLSAHLGGIGEDLNAFGFNEVKLYKQHERRIACNWKLVQEAFLDGYHVVRLHRKTVGMYFPDGVAVSEREAMGMRSVVGRNELLDVLDAPQKDWDFRKHCSFSYSILPSSVIVIHPDYISHLALFPQSPDQTIFIHSMLVDELPTTDKGVSHFDRSFELIDQGVFQSEDIFVCEGAQQGMKSGANKELVFGGHESALTCFHEALAEIMGPDYLVNDGCDHKPK